MKYKEDGESYREALYTTPTTYPVIFLRLSHYCHELLPDLMWKMNHLLLAGRPEISTWRLDMLLTAEGFAIAAK